MSLSQTPIIESPCKLVCELGLSSGQCKGCGRTREEIAMWTRYSDEQRGKIMDELDERMGKEIENVERVRRSRNPPLR